MLKGASLLSDAARCIAPWLAKPCPRGVGARYLRYANARLPRARACCRIRAFRAHVTRCHPRVMSRFISRTRDTLPPSRHVALHFAHT